MLGRNHMGKYLNSTLQRANLANKHIPRIRSNEDISIEWRGAGHNHTEERGNCQFETTSKIQRDKSIGTFKGTK